MSIAMYHSLLLTQKKPQSLQASWSSARVRDLSSSPPLRPLRSITGISMGPVIALYYKKGTVSAFQVPTLHYECVCTLCSLPA